MTEGREIVSEAAGAPKGWSALEYARRLYAEDHEWYRSAETKAQVVLTLDGIFLVAVLGVALGQRPEIVALVTNLGVEAWVLLAAAGATLACSVVSAVVTLVSRTYTRRGLCAFYDSLGVDPQNPSTYVAEVLWFFQHVSGLEKKHFTSALVQLREADELQMLASQIHILSGNITSKHAWVNRAFLFAGLALILLIAFTADYLLTVT